MANDREEASYKQFLEDKVAKLEAEKKDLQEQIERLKREKGISSAREGLTFDQRHGVWLDASTQTRYCPKCLDEDKRNPLMDDKYHWRCNVCGKAYNNPDRPLPGVQRGGTWGRGGGG